MRSGRLSLLALLAVALLVLAGCGPRATGGRLAAAASPDQVVIDLPALVIDIDSSGQPSVGGTPLAELGSLVNQDLAAFTVPAEWVDYLVASNIQHIQIDNTADGLLILVNGEPIPSIAWDGEKLVATAEALETFGAGVALLDKLLPMIRNLGIGVIVRFPVPQGEEIIPLVVEDSEAAAAARAAQEEFLSAVGSPPTFQLVVNYAADGTWNLGDLSEADLRQLAPMPWEMLNLPPALIQAASGAGIQEIGLATNSDGIFISLNGKTLPYITWADGRVNHMLELAGQLGLLEGILGPDPSNMEVMMDTVQSLLPAVQASNVSIKVVFP
ncbi:MAG: hypothetical protein KatS3mg050_2905 [Litorilinea sp.]|nr:MAG: hypothetical protein KatS3mg050_2905 [Litorilinea sp.]